MTTDSYVEHVLDLLGPLGPVRARAMMGGHIAYCGALPIALVYDDRLYLKVDPETRGVFEAAGGEPFTYELRGRVVEMSYWTPPDDALDSPEAMLPWARLALEASARARRPPPVKKRSRPRAAAAAPSRRRSSERRRRRIRN